MKKMKLKEFWQELGSGTRQHFLIEVSQKCQVSIDTVKAWMLGYRSPKGLKRDALFKFIKEIFNVEIIEDGSPYLNSTGLGSWLSQTNSTNN